jgi:hypothetical protein
VESDHTATMAYYSNDDCVRVLDLSTIDHLVMSLGSDYLVGSSCYDAIGTYLVIIVFYLGFLCDQEVI